MAYIELLQYIYKKPFINIKTLLDKAFRLFFPQKVPPLGVIGGKIQVLSAKWDVQFEDEDDNDCPLLGSEKKYWLLITRDGISAL